VVQASQVVVRAAEVALALLSVRRPEEHCSDLPLLAADLQTDFLELVGSQFRQLREQISSMQKLKKERNRKYISLASE
ncbi:MAG TPA: hypothetical protein PLU50_01125, partial [Pseudobdellovibrionaceae bacterium]|nr:hypothetical protein [Pseudobdellovibrionaceae bacterium]